ncbi:MAG TPA: hypothetical protein VFJ13_01260 [Paracoccaceae bacterium]|nr:hypothetical protein [Paracoccaceae bacterium]
MRKMIAAACALLLYSGVSQATVIDFESLARATDIRHSVGSTYSEDGFTLTQDPIHFRQFSIFGTLDPRYPGSTALFNNQIGNLTRLTQVGGGLFSVDSIELAELGGDDFLTVTFEGLLHGGGMVSQSFDLDASFGLELFEFNDSFTNLVSLEWLQGDTPHQFDNITVSSTSVIPLPGTLPMLLGALALLTPLALRRRA